MKHLKLLTIAILLLQTSLGLADDPPSTHGMLVFGDQTIYASHLPMFHRPHDYQVILEVALDQAITALYRRDRVQTATRIYTINPERFVLPKVVAERLPFKADLYRGHFERGGTLIAPNITVHIKEIIHFRKFDPSAVHPASLRYLVFGQGLETYLAHLITAAPDFDQILGVSGQAPRQPRVIQITDHAASEPLHEGDAVQGATVGTEYYLETGDLE